MLDNVNLTEDLRLQPYQSHKPSEIAQLTQARNLLANARRQLSAPSSSAINLTALQERLKSYGK